MGLKSQSESVKHKIYLTSLGTTSYAWIGLKTDYVCLLWESEGWPCSAGPHAHVDPPFSAAGHHQNVLDLSESHREFCRNKTHMVIETCMALTSHKNRVSNE